MDALTFLSHDLENLLDELLILLGDVFLGGGLFSFSCMLDSNLGLLCEHTKFTSRRISSSVTKHALRTDKCGRSRGEIEHITLSKKLFRALLVKDYAAVEA